MFKCPQCGSRCDRHAEKCPECGASVRLLARLSELPDAQFNAALAALERGDAGKCQTLLGSVLTARPADAEAWLLLGWACFTRKQWDAAAECWRLVSQFHPQDKRVRRALDKLAASRD